MSILEQSRFDDKVVVVTGHPREGVRIPDADGGTDAELSAFYSALEINSFMTSLDPA